MFEKIFKRLSASRFRSRFKLSSKDKQYIDSKGWEIIESHARDFIRERISPEVIDNDGKQTPFKNHPVFVAQHATATCCRSCILKWHSFPKNVELTPEQQEYIVKLIMSWIQKNYN